MKPERAWQAVLGQLMMEMPKSNYDTWVRGASFANFKDGEFTISVANKFTLDWLESRLASTIERLLGGLLGEDVEVCFVVTDIGDDVEDDEDLIVDDDSRLVILQGLKDAYVHPEQVHVYPRYLHRWIPYIGTEAFWTLIGFRQAFYVKMQSLPNNGDKRNIGLRTIARFIGRDKNTVLQHRNEGKLGWFLSFENTEKYNIRDGQPTRVAHPYVFLAVTPPTPGDKERLQNWLLVNNVQEEPIEALKELLSTSAGAVLEDPPPVPEPRHLSKAPPDSPETFQKIILSVCNLDQIGTQQKKEVLSLVDDAADHLVQSFGQVFVSLYFLRNWLPLLRGTLACAVTLLRRIGYANRKTKEIRGNVLLKGGRQMLANWLGVSDQTLKTFMPLNSKVGNKRDSASRHTIQKRKEIKKRRELASKFILEASRQKGKKDISIRMQMSDPLIPDHENDYQNALEAVASFLDQTGTEYCKEDVNAFIAGMLENGLINRIEDTNPYNAEDTNPYNLADTIPYNAKDTNSDNTEDTNSDITKDTNPYNDKDTIPYRRRYDFRQLKYIEYLPAKLLRDYLLLFLTTDSITDLTTSTTTYIDSASSIMWLVKERDKWKIDNILSHSGLSNKMKSELNNLVTDPAIVVSYLIMTYSPDGESLTAPWRFILSRLKENPKNPATIRCMSIAKMGPWRVAQLIRESRIGSSGRFSVDMNIPGAKVWYSVMKKQTDLVMLWELGEVLGLLRIEEGTQ